MPEHAPPGLPVLLAAAATLLERVGEVPPLCVDLRPAERWLPPVTLSPVSLNLPPLQQAALVYKVAERMGWALRDVERDALAVTGTIDGIAVEIMAAPLPGVRGTYGRKSQITTAEHAALLRALVDWSAALPPQVIGLKIREDLDNNDDGALTGRLVLSDHDAVDLISDLIVAAPVSDWSGYRGAGNLPTGHALTISVGARCRSGWTCRWWRSARRSRRRAGNAQRRGDGAR